jgi:hypothetical protein
MHCIAGDELYYIVPIILDMGAITRSRELSVQQKPSTS